MFNYNILHIIVGQIGLTLMLISVMIVIEKIKMIVIEKIKKHRAKRIALSSQPEDDHRFLGFYSCNKTGELVKFYRTENPNIVFMVDRTGGMSVSYESVFQYYSIVMSFLYYPMFGSLMMNTLFYMSSGDEISGRIALLLAGLMSIGIVGDLLSSKRN